MIDKKLVLVLSSFLILLQVCPASIFAQTDAYLGDIQYSQQTTTPEEAILNIISEDDVPLDITSQFMSGGNIALSMVQTVPSGPAVVRVQAGDRRLFVKDRKSDGTLGAEYAFTARGVNWSPSTKGAPPQNQSQEFANWYQTDIPLMAQAGINVVRVYHDFGTGTQAQQILDKFYEYGIKVIVEVDSPTYGVVASMSNISAVVNAYKNHPAILMWAVGNEWDINHYYGTFSNIQDSINFTEQAAQLIKSLDANHPVTTVIADPNIPGIHTLSRSYLDRGPNELYTDDMVNTLMPSIDVWGLNLYRGASFQDLFSSWRSITTKPMYIGEFGADSYDHRVNAANPSMQSNFDAGLWDELFYNLSAQRINGTAIGGLAFEWNDEWWKNGDYTNQNITTEFSYGQPDQANDEEWFGLVDIDRNPKAVYATFQDRFLNGRYSTQVNAHPLLTASSKGYAAGIASFGIDDKTVYAKSGGAGGGRGINVAILDSNTGIQMSSVKNFDTYLSSGGWGGVHYNFPALIDYLNSLPNGTVISIAIADEGGFRAGPGNGAWNETNVENAYQALEALGSTQIRNVEYNGGWAMIAVKGQGKLAEGFSAAGTAVTVTATANLTLNANADLVDIFVPTGTLTLNTGNGFTNNTQVTVNINAEDYLGTGIEWMCYSVNDASPSACSQWEPYNAVKEITIPAYQGTNYINVRLRDRVGNEAFLWQSIVYDTTPPAGTVTINNGQAATNSQTVNLQISGTDAGSGVSEMSFSINSLNDASFTAWEPYNASKTLTLPNFEGTNYINVRLKDRAGNVYKYIYNSILFDRTAPTANFTVNNGAAATNDPAVTLQLTASDTQAGPLQMSYAINGTSNFSAWEDFASSKNITLPNFQGTNYINVKIRDGAGNETFVWKTIVLDKTAPTGSFTANGGNPASSSRNVTLNLTGADALPGQLQMSFAMNSTAAGSFSAWENFQTTKSLTLPNFSGTNYINVKLRDAAGNEFFMYQSIFYNPTTLQYQLNRSTFNPGNNQNLFGFDTAAIGKNILVGAPNEDDAGASAGAAYLYNNDSASPNYGQKILTLLNPHEGTAASDFFGVRVTALGTYGLISANFQDVSGTELAGAVYMYQLDPAAANYGSLVRTFNNPTPGFDDEFGVGIKVIGTKIFIGSTGDDTAGTDAGAVYMYEGDPASANFGQLLKTFLNPSPSTTSNFGVSVTGAGQNGDKILISTPLDASENLTTGKAYLFDANPASPTFGQLLRTFATPAASATDWFGSAVASWGKYAFISAEGASKIYMYDVEPSSPTYGQLVKTLQTETVSLDDILGVTMIVSGSRLIVADSNGGASASGKVFVFDIDPLSLTFGTLIQTILNPFLAASDSFGSMLSVLPNGQIVIGSSVDNTTASQQGAFYIYNLS